MNLCPKKSELLHFTRAQKALTQNIRLGNASVKPVESARFLGVWLDRKLRWTRHLKQFKMKLVTQQFALTKLTGSTWGVNLCRAKELYIKIICNAIAYEASAWHNYAIEKRGVSKPD
jgi:hypothetical protein